jgi:hypothetical protein
MKPSIKPNDDLSNPAKVIINAEKIKEEELEVLQSQIKPLIQPYLDTFIRHVFNHIVKICCTRESFYLALSNGDIAKVAYPSNDRAMTAAD